ncbi:MAG: efflux RND transporter periplasmic adaptor subunit [Gammaproteobacteria bacterium]
MRHAPIPRSPFAPPALALLTLAGALLAGCSGDAPPPAAAAPFVPDPAVFLTAAPETVSDGVTLDGTLEAKDKATLTAQTTGRVVKINYDVDDYVPAGAVVMEIAASEQGARAARAGAGLAEAQAAMREAETNYQRAQQLVAQKLISQADFDRVQANYEAAKARVASAEAAQSEAQTQFGYTKVRAPYNGILTARHIEVGELATPGRALVSGLSLGKVRVTTMVPQNFIDAVRAQKKLELVMPDGHTVAATDVVVFPYADEQSHAFKVRADLAPDVSGGIYPGMFVKVRLATGEKQAIRVPAAALVERNEMSGVYVRRADGTPELRQVRTGRRGDGKVEILSGVAAGEIVWRDAKAALQALREPARG